MAGIGDLVNQKLSRRLDRSDSEITRVGIMTLLSDYLEETFRNQDIVQVEFTIPPEIAGDFIDIIQEPRIVAKYMISQVEVDYFVARLNTVDL